MLDTAPYYLLLALTFAPSLVSNKRGPDAGWYAFFIVLLVFVGLRHQVGSDWAGYLQIADEMKKTLFKELFQIQEFLYYFTVWASVEAGAGIYGANVFTTFLLLFGLYKFCNTLPNRWLALSVSLPFLVIVIGMSANRQAAAIGVTLYLLATWRVSGTLRRIITIVVASLFHTSAAVFFLLFVIDGKLSPVKKLIISSVLLYAVVYLIGDSATSERYTSSYIEGRNIFQAAGALQQILLNSIPGVGFLLLRNQLKNRVAEYRAISSMAMLSIALIPAAFVFSVAASRISFYLFPVAIVFLSWLPSLQKTEPSRLLTRYMVLIYGMATLFLWLNYANHAYNHIPYNNLLLIGP